MDKIHTVHLSNLSQRKLETKKKKKSNKKYELERNVRST